MTPLYARLSGALLLLLLIAVPAQAADTVPVDVVDGAVVWSPATEYAQAMLTLSSPSGLEYRRAFGAGESVRMHPSEMGEVPLADGFYEYRLVLAATIPDADEPAEAKALTGTIEVRNGQAVASPLLDIQHLDDVIIAFSLCVGNDCVNGENFGFDTVRLKENNVRIHFNDTSSTGSFPKNDWRIIINDSSNGGAEYFAVEDATAGRQVFRVAAGARANALTVSSAGRVGIGTLTPSVDVHVVTGNTPTLRLAQDGSSGFTAQSFDVAANEANFFIRDVTNGSKLPFRIKPGSADNAIFIDADGVGFNNSNPANLVHVTAKTDRTAVFVDGTAISTGTDPAVRITSGTTSGLVVDGTLITNPANTPAVNVTGNIFASGNLIAGTQITSFFAAAQTANPLAIASLASPGSPIMKLNTAGDLTLTGTSTATNHVNSSDINVKENIAPVDVDAILDGVNSLPISTWEYIADADDALHLGPMAQDFRAAFGLGDNDTTIGTVDASGVALAAIQALAARNEAGTARIAELEAANAALEARLARLEALLGADHE